MYLVSEVAEPKIRREVAGPGSEVATSGEQVKLASIGLTGDFGGVTYWQTNSVVRM